MGVEKLFEEPDLPLGASVFNRSVVKMPEDLLHKKSSGLDSQIYASIGKLALRYGQIMAANKASELMGRSLALFVDRSQHDLTPDQVELAQNFPQIIKQAQADVTRTLKRLAGDDVQQEDEKHSNKMVND